MHYFITRQNNEAKKQFFKGIQRNTSLSNSPISAIHQNSVSKIFLEGRRSQCCLTGKMLSNYWWTDPFFKHFPFTVEIHLPFCLRAINQSTTLRAMAHPPREEAYVILQLRWSSIFLSFFKNNVSTYLKMWKWEKMNEGDNHRYLHTPSRPYCCCSVTKLWPTVLPPWTVGRQAPLSMGFPRQEYWSGLPFPAPGDLPDPGIKPKSPAWQVDFLPIRCLGSPPSLLGIHILYLSVICEYWF